MLFFRIVCKKYKVTRSDNSVSLKLKNGSFDEQTLFATSCLLRAIHWKPLWKKTRYSQYLFMLFLLEFSNLFPSLSFLASFSARVTWCREECEKGERATPRMFVLFNLLKLIYVSVFRFLFEEPGLISGTAWISLKENE